MAAKTLDRRFDLDWLRVIAFGLLMLFHTGMMFTSWNWHVKNYETSAGFEAVMRFLHLWRMPLLFFISGAAVSFVMSRMSTWEFFLNRQKRLLLPLVFGMLVVIPPQVYTERLYQLQQYDSFADFYKSIFHTGSYPEGNLSWHHLWYLPYIWAYAVWFLPVLALAKSRHGQRIFDWTADLLSKGWPLFLLFIPSAIVEIFLRPFYPEDRNNLLSDWANFFHKFTFFAAGFLLAPSVRIGDTIARHRRKFVVGLVVTAVALQSPWLRLAGHAGFRLLLNFGIWMCILAALGYARRYLNFNSRALKLANEAVYPLYILHQTVIVLIGYRLVDLNIRLGPKYLLLLLASSVATWSIYVLLIRPWNVCRVLFGMKALPGLAIKDSPARVDFSSPPEEASGPKARTTAELSSKGAFGPLANRRATVPAMSAVAVLACSFSFYALAPKGSALVCRRFDAAALHGNLLGVPAAQRMLVYLPPSYSSSPERRYPVLYFLPDFNNPLWHYTGGAFQSFRLRDAVDKQIASGVIQEMIVVVPNALIYAGGGWYLNSPVSGNWDDYATRDVVSYVDAHFRTVAAAKARGLAGPGMGGLGAVQLALKHPDVFGSAYAMSAVIFGTDGLREFGVLSEAQLTAWNRQLGTWEHLEGAQRRHAFRDYIQLHLNSPSRSRFFEGLLVSSAAAVSPAPQFPFPHIDLPAAQPPVGTNEVASRFEAALGNWEQKLRACQRSGFPFPAITVEYGKNEEYGFIRHGSDYIAQLMKDMGLPAVLAVHDGSHESTLGHRLETGMLPAMSRNLHLN